jgi:NAD(P)H dehydrogenase (quinone)
MLTEEKHDGQTYNLHGEAITQEQLAGYLNLAFGTNLTFNEMTVEEYRRDRIAELGEFLGGVIAGIYEGIRAGAMDSASQYSRAAGREHQSWADYFRDLGARRTDSNP